MFGSLKLDISNYSMGDQALSHLMAECKNKLEADGQAEAADRVARVAKLSHAQLLELAVEACEGSPVAQEQGRRPHRPGGAAPSVVRGYLDVAGPAAPAVQLARALRARSRRRVLHLVARLQQAAAEVLLHRPDEGAAAGRCAQATEWPLHATRRRAGDHLGRG